MFRQLFWRGQLGLQNDLVEEPLYHSPSNSQTVVAESKPEPNRDLTDWLAFDRRTGRPHICSKHVPQPWMGEGRRVHVTTPGGVTDTFAPCRDDAVAATVARTSAVQPVTSRVALTRSPRSSCSF
jgi:hypothetical protein